MENKISPNGQRSFSHIYIAHTEIQDRFYDKSTLWHIVHLSVSICIWLLGDSYSLFETAVACLSKGLAEVGTHESVDYRINAGVAVGHAVCPYLHFVSVVVLAKVWAECLCQDKQLDGTPAQNKQLYNHQHHTGYFRSYGSTALSLNLELKSSRETA